MTGSSSFDFDIPPPARLPDVVVPDLLPPRLELLGAVEATTLHDQDSGPRLTRAYYTE